MDIITGDLLNITSGVIAHQVNCQNKMGAGVAKALYQRYPAVKSSYHAFCQQMLANGGKPADLLGMVQIVHVTDTLAIANVFGQLYYGHAERTGRVYTDLNALQKGMRLLCNRVGHVYVPYRIGAGLAGADWNDVCKALNGLPVTAVKLP